MITAGLLGDVVTESVGLGEGVDETHAPHTQNNNQNTNNPKNPSRLFQESHPGLLSHISPKTRSTENHPFIEA